MDVAEHLKVFNAAVRSHDWTAFAERFTDNAVVEFVGVPAGPFVGRKAIADAYAQSPPDDTIAAIAEPRVEGDELVVAYRWETTGTTGTMRFVEGRGGIERLVITFDSV